MRSSARVSRIMEVTRSRPSSTGPSAWAATRGCRSIGAGGTGGPGRAATRAGLSDSGERAICFALRGEPRAHRPFDEGHPARRGSPGARWPPRRWQRRRGRVIDSHLEGGSRYGHGFTVTLHPDQLTLPLRWRRPRRIFVNSISDLFHEAVPDDFTDQVFEVMKRADWHIFQVLTKRSRRLAALAPSLS